jgi:hypothetical protein
VPAARTAASSSGSAPSPGCGTRSARSSSARSTPSTRCSSVSAERASAATSASSAPAGSDSGASRNGAVSQRTAIRDRWWATTSCISRAIRARSASAPRAAWVRAARTCSSARARRARPNAPRLAPTTTGTAAPISETGR